VASYDGPPNIYFHFTMFLSRISALFLQLALPLLTMECKIDEQRLYLVCIPLGKSPRARAAKYSTSALVLVWSAHHQQPLDRVAAFQVFLPTARHAQVRAGGCNKRPGKLNVRLTIRIVSDPVMCRMPYRRLAYCRL
jgi:hypothetical protein